MRLFAFVLYALATTSAVVLILWSRSADDPGRDGGPSGTRGGAGVVLEAADREEPVAPRDDAATGTASPAPEEPRPIRIHGRVLEASSGAPLAGCVVHLKTLGARAAVDAADDGGFELELDPAAWGLGSLVTAAVRDASGALLLERPVAPRGPLELRVPPAVRLAGRLECAPPLEYPGTRVAVYTSRPGDASRLLCGSCAIRPDGGFALEVFEPLATDRYLLEFKTGPGSNWLEIVSRAELVSPAGATVARRWTEVAILAKDEAGAPAAGVDVRVAPSDVPSDAQGNLDLCAGTTDESGRLALALAAGQYAFCATLPGHAPAVGTFAVPPGSSAVGIDLELRRLADTDVLHGVILSPIGAPLADALVELRPAVPVPELAPSPVARVRTGADGRFELPCDSRALIALRARHAQHGVLERNGITADERRLRLKFKVVGSARIDPVSPDGRTPDGPVQYFVLDPSGTAMRSGLASAPLILQGLEPGPYVALVLGPGGQTYGRAAFRIEALPTDAVLLRLEPTHRATGRVETADGVSAPGVLVQVEHPHWPAVVRSAWGTTVSGPDGSFDVALGAETSATLAAVDARTAVRAHVQAGEPARLRMGGR